MVLFRYRPGLVPARPHGFPIRPPSSTQGTEGTFGHGNHAWDRGTGSRQQRVVGGALIPCCLWHPGSPRSPFSARTGPEGIMPGRKCSQQTPTGLRNLLGLLLATIAMFIIALYHVAVGAGCGLPNYILVPIIVTASAVARIASGTSSSTYRLPSLRPRWFPPQKGGLLDCRRSSWPLCWRA